MNTNNDQKNRYKLNTIKWILVIFCLIIAIIGNYYFRQYNFLLRIIGIIFLTTIAIAISLLTIQGKSILEFAREAKIEIRKVIWPTHQETLQITLIVVIVTAIMALILWGLDGILVLFISFITTLRF